MNRQEKSLFIERLKQYFSSSEAAFLVSYNAEIYARDILLLDDDIKTLQID